MRLIFFIGCIGVVFWVAYATAEPWLGQRFAQNCAACHSPGRQNLKARDRRCTLSCQGCHVNPNGGGLRNKYGKWNQQRWLRSFAPDVPGSRKRPLPLKSQLYGRRVKKSKKSGLKLKGVFDGGYSEADFDRSDGQDKVTVKKRRSFLQRIPDSDPYRLKRSEKLLFGADFRYLILEQTGEGIPEAYKSLSFPMAFDVGVRWRPPGHHFSFVYESRMLNSPDNEDFFAVFEAEAITKSAYLLIDDLPYASYVMLGNYVPLFGRRDPNHSSLSQVISGFNQRSLYSALTIGMSPNVPFINIHLIRPAGDEIENQETGVAFNLGGRWVTKSISVMLSHWETSSPNEDGGIKKKSLQGLTMGIKLGHSIFRMESIYIRKELSRNALNAGNVTSFNLRQRVWRENYLTASYSFSNVAKSLNEGKVTETSYGYRSFLLSGLDLEAQMVARNETIGTEDFVSTALQIQIHLFF